MVISTYITVSVQVCEFINIVLSAVRIDPKSGFEFRASSVQSFAGDSNYFSTENMLAYINV